MPKESERQGRLRPPDATGRIREGITHSAPPEIVEMDKYHFLWVLERMDKQRSVRPAFSWWLIPLAMFLGVIATLLTADFKDTLGASKDTWHALMIGTALVTAVAWVALLVWWAVVQWKHHDPTPEELLAGVIDQMAVDRERLERLGS
jgi:hypothetical protein